MKSTINENGVLIVEAETPTERYALMQWWHCFMQASSDDFENVPRPRSSIQVIYEPEVTECSE